MKPNQEEKFKREIRRLNLRNADLLKEKREWEKSYRALLTQHTDLQEEISELKVYNEDLKAEIENLR